MNKIVAILVLLTLTFAGLFVADLRGYFNRVQKPVAELRFSDGTVSRLGNHQLTWDRAEKGALFATGDTISTGENARAKLVFYGGGELELNSGSMVVLAGSLEELKLNFVTGGGKVRIAKDSARKITVAKVKKAPAAKKLVAKTTVNSAPKSGAPVVTSEPEIEAQNSTEATEELTQETPMQPSEVEVSVVDTKKVAKPVTIAKIDPKAPAAAAQASPLLEPELEFAPKPLALTLSLAIQEKSIRSPQAQLVAKAGIISTEELPPAPLIKSPAADAVIDLATAKAPRLEWDVQLKKTDQKIEKMSYEVVLRPADGKGPEKVLKSDQSAIALNLLGRGKYLWSVRAVNASGKRGPASVSRWLEVKVPAQISRPVVLPVEVE